jgi:hypothetical protein
MSEEKKTRDLLAEARGTINAANEMAKSVNAAIQSLESFMRCVVPPRTNAIAEPVNNDRRPFDVLDYGKAADHIGGMAREINTLLTSVNQSMPQAKQLGQQATDNVESVVRRSFWLALVLIGVLLVGGVLAGLAYRILLNKFTRSNGEPSTQS